MVITIIFDEKNEKIKITCKYQIYVDVFDEIDANKLLKHKSYDHAIETKSKIFFSNLFTICLLLSLNF